MVEKECQERNIELNILDSLNKLPVPTYNIQFQYQSNRIDGSSILLNNSSKEVLEKEILNLFEIKTSKEKVVKVIIFK